MKKCYIFQIGKFWESPDTTRVFSSYKKALASIPKGFTPLQGAEGYTENKKRGLWCNIKSYSIE